MTRRLHVGFVAPSRAHVDAFWRAGTRPATATTGAPGPRPQYSDDYYGAFLLDPDGNSVEAVHHGALRERRAHRPRLDPRRRPRRRRPRFYETVARAAGFRAGRRPARPDAVTPASAARSRSSAGTPRPSTSTSPSRPPTTRRSTRFHRDATAAGYRDNGAPGRAAVYHAGYYGAFVLDPDGNNVEVVYHNR